MTGMGEGRSAQGRGRKEGYTTAFGTDGLVTIRFHLRHCAGLTVL